MPWKHLQIVYHSSGLCRDSREHGQIGALSVFLVILLPTGPESPNDNILDEFRDRCDKELPFGSPFPRKSF